MNGAFDQDEHYIYDAYARARRHSPPPRSGAADAGDETQQSRQSRHIFEVEGRFYIVPEDELEQFSRTFNKHLRREERIRRREARHRAHKKARWIWWPVLILMSLAVGLVSINPCMNSVARLRQNKLLPKLVVVICTSLFHYLLRKLIRSLLRDVARDRPGGILDATDTAIARCLMALELLLWFTLLMKLDYGRVGWMAKDDGMGHENRMWMVLN